MKRARILIVDDSATARAALRAALSLEPSLEVVGEAADGAQTFEGIRRLRPDLLTMDVFLRAENGLDLAASIMTATPLPIVVVTAADTQEPSLVFRAMQAGALEVCAKLPSPSRPDYAARRARLIRTIKTLHEVPVVRRTQPRAQRLPVELLRRHRPDAATAGASGPAKLSAVSAGQSGGLLLIGASTGGPPVVAKLLRALPRPLPCAVGLVQHMTPGFVSGFLDWLAEETLHPVSRVEFACSPTRGVVYAPGPDQHLVIERRGWFNVSRGEPRGFHRPAIDVLFDSAAASCVAAHTVAVLLTGMGDDGAKGLLRLRRRGARTIAQDPFTCAVSSMPNAALELAAADLVLSPEAMPAVLSSAFEL